MFVSTLIEPGFVTLPSHFLAKFVMLWLLMINYGF